MMAVLVYGSPFALSLASLIWAIVWLCTYIKTPKDEAEQRQHAKRWLIVSSIVTGILWLALIALIVLFTWALSHM